MCIIVGDSPLLSFTLETAETDTFEPETMMFTKSSLDDKSTDDDQQHSCLDSSRNITCHECFNLETAETDAFIPETLQFGKVVSRVKTPVMSTKTLVATLVFIVSSQDQVEMETRNTFYAAEILGSIWYQKAKNEISNFKTFIFVL